MEKMHIERTPWTMVDLMEDVETNDPLYEPDGKINRYTMLELLGQVNDHMIADGKNTLIINEEHVTEARAVSMSRVLVAGLAARVTLKISLMCT